MLGSYRILSVSSIARLCKSMGVAPRRNFIYRDTEKLVIPNHHQTVTHFMKDRCQLFKDSTALIDVRTNKHYSYDELFSLVGRFAHSLRERNFGPGDVYITITPNTPEMVIAILGAMATGGTASAINPLFTTGEIERALDLVRPKIVHTVPSICPSLQQIIPKIDSVKDVFVTDGKVSGYTPFEDVVSTGRKFDLPDVNIDINRDLAFLPFSSGTSGLPKVVCSSHFAMIGSIYCMMHNNRYGMELSETVQSPFPYFHIAGSMGSLWFPIYQGATILVDPQFNMQKFVQNIQEYKVNVLGVTPNLARALATGPFLDGADLKSINRLLVGGGPVGNELQAKIHDVFGGLRLYQVYGMSELVGCSHAGYGFDTPEGSVGKVLPNTECKLVDDDGNELGPGEIGELCVRTPFTMQGYLNNVEATREALDSEGWYHTGDIGRCDENDFMFILDRKKEMIKSKGFQVAPAEVEDVLLMHPAVMDVGVVGVPSLEDELPRAYVVLKPGAEVTETELQKHVEDHLAHYKRLRGGVRFVEELPKLASGKILRRELQKLAKSDL